MKTSTVPQLYSEVLDAWSILYDANPAESNRQWINIGYWDDAQSSYETACDKLAAQLSALGKFSSTDHILDVGCGTGTSSRFWSDELFQKEGSRPQIEGINITPRHIEIANELTDSAVYGDNIRFTLADATRLDSHDSLSIDKVAALECAFHFDTREAFLHEAFRLLRPGGILVMADILMKKSTPTYEKWRRFLPSPLIRPLFEKPSQYMAMPLANQIDATSLKKTLKQIGFTTIDIQTINPLTKPFQRHYKNKMKAYLKGDIGPWLPPFDKKHITKFKRKMDFTAFTLNLADYVLVKAKKPCLKRQLLWGKTL